MYNVARISDAVSITYSRDKMNHRIEGFKLIFNNTSVISLWSALLVEYLEKTTGCRKSLTNLKIEFYLG
jgi:dipeptide/tripeptide permease